MDKTNIHIAEKSFSSGHPQCEMNEKVWWDFWNTSYRLRDDGGEIPTELFTRTAAVVNQITPKDGRVLEIGCGAGSLSRRLRYSSYHGVDISPAAIDIARQKHDTLRRADSSVTTYEAADFHDWTAPPEPFDVAVCVDAVAYFRDQSFALKKMTQSLRRSGALVLTTINPFVYHRIRRTPSRPLSEGSISRWLTRDELHGLMKSAGLSLEKSYTIMPRGDAGFLRIINSRHLNHLFGSRWANCLKRMKERVGLGQYRVVVGRKIQ